ncbi:MAG: MFS transporter [Candidatus Thorarchaeota archaeon]
MIAKERFRLLIPIGLFHTMAHIYPYLLPILCLVIREDILMNYTQIAILSMTGILVTIPLTIVFGFLGDKISKWRLELIIAGFVLVFGHTYIIYVAQTYAILIIAAVIGGIGSSVFHPIALPLLSLEFGKDRNLAHSVNLIFGTLGSIITPIASISLSSWLGWRITSLIFGIAGTALFPILLIFTLLGKKYLQYIPEGHVAIGEQVISVTKNSKRGFNGQLKNKLSFITVPLIAVILAQIIRSGTFRVVNTFTVFIFEDKFGASEIGAALIMSIILGMGGIAALISGFVSSKYGSLKTFLYSKGATTIASVFVILFVGFIALSHTTVNIYLLILAIFLFILLTTSFYFGSPSANGLFAEMVPGRVLSSTFGIVNSLMTGFSALTPVIFGAIVDQNYSLPYEYLLLVIFSLIPFLLLLYTKIKTEKENSFKTIDDKKISGENNESEK